MAARQSVTLKSRRSFAFSEKLLHWYDRIDRRQFPWQKNKTPYRVWVSEIMLQQTQANKVVDRFKAFIRRFPSLKRLASAEITEVLEQWAGLGYYQRAHRLHATARIIRRDHGGRFPQTFSDLLALPGIGKSTAGAIFSLAFKRPYAALDGNIKRVLSRYCDVAGHPEQAQVKRRLWREADALLPERRIADYTQAIMELGASVCKPRNPQCAACPAQTDCRAYRQGLVERRPGPSPRKKARPVCRLFMLMIQRSREVVLERRPDQGIWGGLLCPPQSSSERGMRRCLRQLRIKRMPRRGKAFLHELSHRRLLITPHFVHLTRKSEAQLDSSRNWYKIDANSMAIPAAVKKLLLQSTARENRAAEKHKG